MADFYSREMVGAAIDGIKRERFSMVLYNRVLYREYVDMDVVKIVKGSLQPVAIKVQTLFSITLPLPLMEWISVESRKPRGFIIAGHDRVINSR